MTTDRVTENQSSSRVFRADTVLNTEKSSEDTSAIVACALLSVVFSHEFGG